MTSLPVPVSATSKIAYVEDESPTDAKMTGTGDSAGGTENPKTLPKKKKQSGWDEEGYKAMKRINKLAPDDYYGFLNLKKTCSTAEIKAQYKALALLVHKDKINFRKEEKKAFHRISDAYQILKDSDCRAQYDKQNGGVYKMPDLEDPEIVFGEEFGPNAFGDDSASEDDEEEDSDENVKVKPNQAHMAIYNSAPPLIQRVLANPPMTKEEKDANSTEVKAIHEQIKEQNAKDGLQGDDLFQLYLEYTPFESNALLAKPWIDELRNNPQDSKAEEWVTFYDSVLKYAIRTHGYPTSWTLKESALPKATPKATGRTPKPAGNASFGKTAQDQTGSAASSETIVNWQPGLTLAGDIILGVLPRERNVRRMVDGVRLPTEKIVFGYQFITKRETENGPTIALESGEEVGNKATAGYFNLPKEKIVDLRYSEERYSQDDAESFDKLLDFASNPFQTRSSNTLRFPPGYGLASFKDGTEDVLSRTALRKMLRKTDADLRYKSVRNEMALDQPGLLNR